MSPKALSKMNNDLVKYTIDMTRHLDVTEKVRCTKLSSDKIFIRKNLHWGNLAKEGKKPLKKFQRPA